MRNTTPPQDALYKPLEFTQQHVISHLSFIEWTFKSKKAIRMNLKLVVLCASLAVISCAHVDSREHIEIQKQHAEDVIQRQSEKIREHHEREEHQREMQQQQLEDQFREQAQKISDFEQKIRDDAQERKDRVDGEYFVRTHYHPTAFIAFHQVPFVYPTRYDDSNYNFAYTVSDMSTGDHKSHQETRRGDQVQGQYKLMDSDGYQRIVNYRANDRDGFDAEVRREPLTTLAQHHQTQQNYAGHHNQHRQNYFFTQQHPSVYASSSFSKNDDGRHH